MRQRLKTLGSGSSSSSSSPSMSLDEKLRRILTNVQFFLVEAEKKIVEAESDKHLVRELWKIYYDADDALRDYEEWRSSSSSTGSCVVCRKRKKPEVTVEESSNFRNPCSLCIEHAISQVLQDFDNISKNWKALHLPEYDRKPAPQVRQQSGSLSSDKIIYGMEEDRDYIVNLILTPSGFRKLLDARCADVKNEKLIIFPVIGAPGTGKTTLVQHVYHDKRITKDYFEKKAWVSCVGKEGDALQLLNSVLEAVGGESVGDRGQVSVAQDRIRGRLTNQRLFLVLDDACATRSDFWETFFSTIENSVAEGSIAMVIAQKYQVLEAMPSYLPRLAPYIVYPLTFDDCWSIFKSTISRSPNCFALEDEDDDFTKIGRQIVKKYEGFPGTIKHAARQLSNSSDIVDWEGHLNTNSSGSYYSISFHQLTHRAKRCLRYCCLFPEGHSFDRDYLIRLWTAEEFVDGGKKEKGADYFEELLHNFFLLQRGHIYQIPIIVRDILGDSDLFIRTDSKNTGQSSSSSSSSEGRHLSFTGRETEANLPQSMKALQHMLSILTFRCKVPRKLDFFPEMGHLRTLELSYSVIKILPDSIGSLRNLRFLGLNWTLIKALPDSVGKLQHLRFLGLNGTLIEALPDSICTLTNLLALELESCRNLCGLPKGLDKLTNLQTLPVFKLGQGNGQYSGLRELAELVNLKNELSILGLQFHHDSKEKLRVSYLEKMQSLKSLKLCWFSSPSDEPEHHHSRIDSAYSRSRHCDTIKEKENRVLENLKPHVNLQKLIIGSYSGSVLPEWIACHSFRKIEFIYLKDCVNCESLPSLGQLPLLKRLIINCPAVSRIDNKFCNGPRSFTCLEELVLVRMTKLERWTGVEKGHFQILKQLECNSCPRLEQIPHFENLKQLECINCPRLEQIPQIASLESLKMDNCKYVAVTPGFSFTKLEFINLKDCLNCVSLPSLGRLPVLKRLVINCPAVRNIDDQFCGGSDSFPSLEELILIGMLNLEKWIGVKKDDFKKLKELECIGCPRLVQIPEIASLKKLKMDKCEKVTITPGFSSVQDLQICATICSGLAELTSLVHLSLLHCQGPVHLSKLPQLKYLWVEDCKGLKLGDGIKLSYLDALFVANCPHDIVLPKEMKQPPYSLFEDDHTLSFEKNLESSE